MSGRLFLSIREASPAQDMAMKLRNMSGMNVEKGLSSSPDSLIDLHLIKSYHQSSELLHTPSHRSDPIMGRLRLFFIPFLSHTKNQYKQPIPLYAALTASQSAIQARSKTLRGESNIKVWNIIIVIPMLTSSPSISIKLQSKYTSATNSQGEASLSARKKPFQRKPASSQLSNTSEKKRRSTEQQLQAAIMDIHQFQVEPCTVHTDGAVKINFVKRKERQTEWYIKEKEASFEGFYKPKNANYSPHSSKKNLFDGVGGYSSNGIKQMDGVSNTSGLEHSCPSTPSSSRVVFEEYKNVAEPCSFQTYINPRKRAELSFPSNSTPTSTPSFTKLTRTNAVLAKQQPKLRENVGREGGGRESMGMVECSYCKNNKQMTDIMCEKYRKLQQQLVLKNQKIRQLTNRLESVKEQHSKLNEKYQSKLEATQLRQIQFLRERQELMSRIDTYKSDLGRLSERLKYADMQKGMLLRYKDEIQLMEKEYDLMLAENDRLQRALSARRGPEDKFKKFREPQGERKTPNVPYLHAMGHKHSIEDDLVSLSLSERSFDQF